MLLFNIAINIIESFVLSSFFVCLTDIRKKIKCIALLTTISFVLVTCFDQMAGEWQYVLLILESLFFLGIAYLFEKKIKFEYIFMYITAFFILNLSNTLALVITSLGYNIQLFSLSKFRSLLINATFLSKALFLFLSFIFYLIIRKYQINLPFQKWWPLLCIELASMICLNFIIYMIIYGISTFRMGVLALSIGIVPVLVLLLGYRIQTEERKYTLLLLENENRIKLEDMYNKVDLVKKNVEDMQHKLMFVLLDLKKKTEDVEIINFVDQYVAQLKQYTDLFVTHNIYFDTMMSSKLNTLFNGGRNVKLSIFISQHELYDSTDFVKLMLNCLEFLDKESAYASDLELYMHEEGVNSVVRFICQLKDDKDFDLTDEIKQSLNNLQGTYQIKKLTHHILIRIIVEKKAYDAKALVEKYDREYFR